MISIYFEVSLFTCGWIFEAICMWQWALLFEAYVVDLRKKTHAMTVHMDCVLHQKMLLTSVLHLEMVVTFLLFLRVIWKHI